MGRVIVRIISGIQPSGRLHLGNYFGAIKPQLDLQNADCERYYFIADYHAMTSLVDSIEYSGTSAKETLDANVRETVLDYLALGLDTTKTVFYRQSDVPEVCELAWMLATVSGMGLLERAHSFKDKAAKGISATVGLFTYPILMAADILIMQANEVLVGNDQIQHVEITRDIAKRFNDTYGSWLTIPNSKVTTSTPIPGTDGAKMSKSYRNTISIFGCSKDIKKSVMGIVTDSKGLGETKNPDESTIYQLYKRFASPEQDQSMRNHFKNGGGYGYAKRDLFEIISDHFKEAIDRRHNLSAHPSIVDEVLNDGTVKARATAKATMQSIRNCFGMK